MHLQCPACERRIENEDVNVASDIARCAGCGQVFRASELVDHVEIGRDLEPPAGSGITFESETATSGALRIPRAGLRLGDLGAILFATFWMGFIAFWTWGASRGSTLFALFSIPFWIVGLGLWRGLIIGWTETQILAFDDLGLRVTKRSLFSSSTREIPYDDISKVEMTLLLPRNPFSMARYFRRAVRLSVGTWGAGMPMAAIRHGTKQTLVGEQTSEAEMEWIVRVLGAIVRRRAARPS